MRAFRQRVCRSVRSGAARKTLEDRPLVDLTKKNRDAFWDANIAQAAIDMKRIQVMLELVSHLSHRHPASIYPNTLAKIVPKRWRLVFNVISMCYVFAREIIPESV